RCIASREETRTDWDQRRLTWAKLVVVADWQSVHAPRQEVVATSAPTGKETGLTVKEDLLWYKDTIIYQVHVRTFFDSNGDGIGDFHGLEQKLEYLQELGITAIWLMPFFPSPLRDDGYDIADYKSVHASYGTLEDFKRFLNSAHDRGIRVIIEMVLNHTSDQH